MAGQRGRPRRAGLVWSTPAGAYAFAVLRFDPRLVRRYGVQPADLAATALERLGLIEARHVPRAFRRSLRVRPVSSDRVTAPQ